MPQGSGVRRRPYKPPADDKVSKLRGTMAAPDIRDGEFACTACNSDPVFEFVRETLINLLEDTSLPALICQRTSGQQRTLLEIGIGRGVFETDVFELSGVIMLRVHRALGRVLGVANYPSCQSNTHQTHE